jgi:hypothetical protein
MEYRLERVFELNRTEIMRKLFLVIVELPRLKIRDWTHLYILHCGLFKAVFRLYTARFV